MNHAVIGIGSNIRPNTNIPKAIDKIAQAHRVLKQSRIVETDPVGVPNQPKFLNGALLIETKLEHIGLKAWLLGIENELGRVRGAEKDGPRTIDLDIVVWSGKIVDPDVYWRDYLRQAVSEVYPFLKVRDSSIDPRIVPPRRF